MNPAPPSSLDDGSPPPKRARKLPAWYGDYEAEDDTVHGVSRSELALRPKSLEQRARPRHASLTVNTPLLECLAGDEEAEAVWRAACSAGKRNLSQEVHGWRIKWVPRHASQGTKDGDWPRGTGRLGSDSERGGDRSQRSAAVTENLAVAF